MKVVSTLLMFVAVSAQAHLIGSVTGVIKAGCDACGDPNDAPLFGGYTDFGLGAGVDLSGQRYTFNFSISDIVFARAPIADGQGGMAARWAMNPGEVSGSLTVNGHTLPLSGETVGFNAVGIGPRNSLMFNYDMEGQSPLFARPNHELKIAAFDTRGQFFFNHRVGLPHPERGTANWNGGFNGTVDGVVVRPQTGGEPKPGSGTGGGAGAGSGAGSDPRPQASVFEPSSGLLALGGLLALVGSRRRFRRR